MKIFNLKIILDMESSTTMLLDKHEVVWPWNPIPFTNDSYCYAKGSLTAGLHSLYSEGHYTVYIYGSLNGSGYGFIPAYNGKFNTYCIICPSLLYQLLYGTHT